ncbi:MULTISPECIES: phosphatase PAP2 family protein [unclassified Streptomyces]|uniref:phosphatase PAP2 family protein n=1 Tax=unclassified Streptomyces TaxID=2593676 RepID=UPI00166067EE|nr:MULTISPECIES: phosphatase PAP2 family protein [unclassified Streptomyces]MBD0710476.1 phosphoesterase [Streptomyces sp. CBMA291]MBD0712804.1 phosphoesterase [Streptomyces sp. CBMA370]
MTSYDRARAGGGPPKPSKSGDTWWYAAVAGEAAGSFSARVHARTRHACLGAVLLLAVVYAGLVLTATGRRWGDAAVTGRRADATAAALLREHPSLAGLTPLSLVLGAVLLLAVGLIRRRYALTGLAAAGIAAALAVTGLLQRYAPRPRLLDPGGALLPSGFPSAQTTLALGIALGLILVVPYRLRTLATGAATLWAVAVGAYTLATGSHRPGDAIAAALVVLAVFCGLLAVRARKGLVRPGPRRGAALPGLPVTVPLALIALAGLGTGLWLLGGTLDLPATAPYDPAELRLAHRAGQALAAAVTAIAGLLPLALLRRVDIEGPPASYRLGGPFVEAAGAPADEDLVGPFTEDLDHEIS